MKIFYFRDLDLARHRRGFTLVEVMIVLMVIALLVTIAIPQILRVRLIANESIAQATLKTISNALETYANDTQEYPVDPNLLLTTTPTYLNSDYFTGTHSGYTYSPAITNYSYQVTATPVSPNTGSRTFAISTGGVLAEVTPPTT